MKAILILIRKHYDKIIHIAVSALVLIALSRLFDSSVFLVLSALAVGVAWEFANTKILGIKFSWFDMLANFIGALLGLIILWWI